MIAKPWGKLVMVGGGGSGRCPYGKMLMLSVCVTQTCEALKIFPQDSGFIGPCPRKEMTLECKRVVFGREYS